MAFVFPIRPSFPSACQDEKVLRVVSMWVAVIFWFKGVLGQEAHAMDRWSFFGAETWDARSLSAGQRLMGLETEIEGSAKVYGLVNETSRQRAAWAAPTWSVLWGLNGDTDVGWLWAAYRGMDVDQQVSHGSSSPRFFLRHTFRASCGAAAAGLWPCVGMALGFKWPTANEPQEIDEGDFLAQLLLSGGVGQWEWHVNTGPLILGDPTRNRSQWHVWNFAIRGVWHWGPEPDASQVQFEWVRNLYLPGRWYAFWEGAEHPLERSRVAVSVHVPWRGMQGHSLAYSQAYSWIRASRSLIVAGTDFSVSLGMPFPL